MAGLGGPNAGRRPLLAGVVLVLCLLFSWRRGGSGAELQSEWHVLQTAASAAASAAGDGAGGGSGSGHPQHQPAAGTAAAGPLAHLSVMVALIGRDVATELPWVLRNVARLADRFGWTHLVLVENDSFDGTPEVFNALSAKWTADAPERRSTRLISFQSGGAQKKDLALLAKARNHYLDALAGEEAYAAVDYLLVVDTDMCHAWDIDPMERTIAALLPHSGSEWHALYANGACGWGYNVSDPPFWPGTPNLYCDLFALRDSQGAEHTMEHSTVWLMPGTCDLSHTAPASAATLECRQLAGQAVIPVQAAFGGWAFYRAELFRGERGCRHAELYGCEHVSLSSCLRKRHAARQLIATGLVVNWEGCDEAQQHQWDSWHAAPRSAGGAAPA